MCYIYHTADLGIEIILDWRERDLVFFIAQCDSDHAGDKLDSHSTSGWVVVLRGPKNTRALLDWGSRRQTNSSRSTPEAEVVAAADCICRSLFPILTLWEEIMVREFKFWLGMDADAARQAIENGRSHRMRHLKKYHRVNLGFFKDAVKLGNLDRVSSDRNRSDVMTKILAAAAFFGHLYALGLRSKPE